MSGSFMAPQPRRSMTMDMPPSPNPSPSTTPAPRRTLRRETRSIYDWREGGKVEFTGSRYEPPKRSATWDQHEDEVEIHSDFKQRMGLGMKRRDTVRGAANARSMASVLEEAEEEERQVEKERLRKALSKVLRPTPGETPKRASQEGVREDYISALAASTRPTVVQEVVSEETEESFVDPRSPAEYRSDFEDRRPSVHTPPQTIFDPPAPSMLRIDTKLANLRALAPPPLSIPSPPPTPPLPPDFSTPTPTRSRAVTPSSASAPKSPRKHSRSPHKPKTAALHIEVPEYVEPAPLPEDIIPNTPKSEQPGAEFPFPVVETAGTPPGTQPAPEVESYFEQSQDKKVAVKPSTCSPDLQFPLPQDIPVPASGASTPRISLSEQQIATKQAHYAQHLRNLALHRRRQQLMATCQHLFVSAPNSGGRKFNPWLACAKCSKKKLRQAWSGGMISARSSRSEEMRSEWLEHVEERVWVETFTDGDRVWGRWEREEVVYGKRVSRRQEPPQMRMKWKL